MAELQAIREFWTMVGTVVAAAASVVATMALIVKETTARRAEAYQEKRYALVRFLQSRYGIEYQKFADSLSEIPIVFSDVPEVLNIRTQLREITSDPTYDNKDGRADILLDNLQEALYRAVNQKYDSFFEIEPFAQQEVCRLTYLAGRRGRALRDMIRDKMEKSNK